jgi:hypothetical protein
MIFPATGTLRSSRVIGITTRSLGTSTRGPPLRKVGDNFAIFVNSFKRPSQDYLEFRQKCTSARVFVYWGLVATLSTLLVVDPPRSCYWTNWNVWRWPSNCVNFLFRAKGEGAVFLNEKSEGEQNVPETYAFLVANRRLPHEDARAQTLALIEKHSHH